MSTLVTPSISHTIFIIFAAVTLVACLGESTSTGAMTSAGASSGTGGAGGDGSVQYPACLHHVATFTGKLDGQPFDRAIPTDLESLSQADNPHYLHLPFTETGGIDLIWTENAGSVDPVAVAGTLRLPGESSDRTILSGSTMILSNDLKFSFLLYNDSHLLICDDTP